MNNCTPLLEETTCNDWILELSGKETTKPIKRCCWIFRTLYILSWDPGWDILVPWGVNLPNFQRFIMFAIMYAYTVGIGFWNVISSSCCRSIDFSIVLQVLHVLNCRCRNMFTFFWPNSSPNRRLVSDSIVNSQTFVIQSHSLSRSCSCTQMQQI